MILPIKNGGYAFFFIKKNNKTHTFKHLHSTTTCFDSYNSLSFTIIDKANSKFDLRIKEALNISWRKPNLNAQQNHSALTLSLQLLCPLFFSVCFFSAFLFHLLFFIICDTSLLLDLITTFLVSLSLSFIIFIISMLIISIFHCLSYTSLLLHLIITHLVNISYNNYVINVCPSQLL